MGRIAAFGRLIGAGWRLARNDALLPRELEELYPPSILALSGTVRLLAGAEARRGRPGEQLWGLGYDLRAPPGSGWTVGLGHHGQ